MRLQVYKKTHLLLQPWKIAKKQIYLQLLPQIIFRVICQRLLIFVIYVNLNPIDIAPQWKQFSITNYKTAIAKADFNNVC